LCACASVRPWSQRGSLLQPAVPEAALEETQTRVPQDGSAGGDRGWSGGRRRGRSDGRRGGWSDGRRRGWRGFATCSCGKVISRRPLTAYSVPVSGVPVHTCRILIPALTTRVLSSATSLSPDCLVNVYRCTGTRSPHPLPGTATRYLCNSNLLFCHSVPFTQS